MSQVSLKEKPEAQSLFFSLKENLEVWLHSLFQQFLKSTNFEIATSLCIFFLRV